MILRLSIGAASLAGVCVAENASALEFGAGLMVQAGGNFIGKPDAPGPGSLNANPGFGGLTVGGGLMLDARLIPFLGLEVDVLRTNDKGSGDYTINGSKNHITLSQGAWHVPILAKVVLPSPLLAPYAVLGPEYVSPSDPSAEADPKTPGINFSAFASSYWMVTAGLGLEIKLPLPIIDLRIPVSLRASFNPGASSKYTDRTKGDINTLTLSYSSEWQYAVNLTAGAALYF